MKDNSRSLTFTIEASSPEDFNALLRQARYEIEKLLPLLLEATEEARNRALGQAIFSDTPREQGQITRGYSSGTLGRYEFEMVKGSREYAEFERVLLSEGFERRPIHNRFGFESDQFGYFHAERGTKVIDGNPLAVRKHMSGEDF